MFKVEKADLAKLKKLHEEGKLVGVFETSSEDYHNAPGISKSALDDIAKAPAAYDYLRRNPDEPTEEMEFGQVLHCLVLEPEKFQERYAVAPESIERRGTKDWNAFVAANPGKQHLKHGGERGFAAAEKIAKAARAHSRVALLAGLKELSFFWKDPTTGILCKCRPDNLTVKGVITDYKTCQLAYPARAWARQVLTYRIHVQAAFYLDGVVHALEQAGMSKVGFPVPKHFVTYAQEKTGPYLVKPWLIAEASVALGRRAYQEDLRVIKSCETSMHWPGYPESIEEVNCPEYAWENEGESNE